jgi:hypothetical protein
MFRDYASKCSPVETGADKRFARFVRRIAQSLCPAVELVFGNARDATRDGKLQVFACLEASLAACASSGSLFLRADRVDKRSSAAQRMQ